MTKTKVAIVPVASHFESGGERGEDILENAKEVFFENGLDVITASKIVWNNSDAVDVVNQLISTDPDLLVIIHITWVCDSIQYIFTNNFKCPVVLWAVPYTETFSIGCVQHFGSILKENDINYWYVYGLPEDKDVQTRIKSIASTSKIYKDLKRAKIALIGPPRQTWRLANAQDMTKEEWDFSKKFGVTIIHIEIEELINHAKKISSVDANQVINDLKKKNRLGKVGIDEERLLFLAKFYLGIKELMEKNKLTAAAAECYPKYSGLANLPSSLLADEGVILDTEGDIGHTFLQTAMYQMGKISPTALSEVGSIDFEGNFLYLDHEGSSAHSLAEDFSKVHISKGGDGAIVGFPYKSLPEITLSNITGTNGNYKILISKGLTEKIDQKIWFETGSKLLIKAKFDIGAKDFFNKMISNGVDHHLIVKEGNISSQLYDFCDMFKVNKVII